MKKFIVFFWMICFNSFAQKVYEANEVDRPAEPTGGPSMLNHFVSSNLQMPIIRAVKGVNGRVFVKGIVEPDGSMTELKIVKGLDSIADREALRLMSLFRAWKPALVKESAVRQSFVYPVLFQIPPISNYDSTLNALTYYFNDRQILVPEKDMAKFRTIIPVDLLGHISGDVLYEKIKGENWKTTSKRPVQRKKEWYRLVKGDQTDSAEVSNISVAGEDGRDLFQNVSYKKDGGLLSYTEYNANGGIALKKRYYKSGGLREMYEHGDSLVLRTDWYEKGYMKSVIQYHEGPERERQFVVKGVWDQNGNPVLTAGNGWCRIPAAEYQGNAVWEEGRVELGLKTGKWVGKLADSTQLFEELYSGGQLLKGYALTGQDKVEYTSGLKQPAFESGINGMYQFISQNIKYPLGAMKSRVMGKVVLSFVVCEDGTLCEYKVVNGVERSLDTEALRVVRAMNGKWKPGMIKGRRVRVKYFLPVNFQML